MFFFGKKKREEATQIAEFQKEEVEKNLIALSQFDMAALELLARDIYATYRQIDGNKKNKKTLKSIVRFAMNKRHEALAAGANDRNDPLWNCAALIESIGIIELLSLRGMDGLDRASWIRGRMESFLDQHLSGPAKAEIDALFENPA